MTAKEHRTNMASKSAYLGGGITGLTSVEARHWREQLKAVFNNLIDPCDFPWTFWDHGLHVADRVIVEGDKQYIDQCDVMLVMYNPLRISWGTAQEQLYAWERKKSILTWFPEDFNVLHASAWVRYHSTLTVHSFGEVVHYLKEWGVE